MPRIIFQDNAANHKPSLRKINHSNPIHPGMEAT